VLYKNRDMKPARDYLAGHETLMYTSLSETPLNSLMLSTDLSALSTIAGCRLPVDLATLRQLASVHMHQGKTWKFFYRCYGPNLLLSVTDFVQ